MKRQAALAQLSRDHHHTLVLARRLREAQQATAADEARRLLEHWDAEERMHFRLEEEILLPAYAMHASPDHPAILHMLVDHVLIRRDVSRIEEDPRLEQVALGVLHNLGRRLEAHVRLEEREVFPLIEGALPHDELTVLGERLSDGERQADGCKPSGGPP
jgi:iron-sulfur cluster repair protein YtfE (RIC family)